MNTQRLTQRIPLDRTIWHAVRCALGFHVPARFELKEFVMYRKEGRKVIEFSVLMNVQEAICCGKTLETERVA